MEEETEPQFMHTASHIFQKYVHQVNITNDDFLKVKTVLFFSLLSFILIFKHRLLSLKKVKSFNKSHQGCKVKEKFHFSPSSSQSHACKNK